MFCLLLSLILFTPYTRLIPYYPTLYYMSTPKINFFIKKIAGREPPGRARVRSGKRTIVRVSSPGAQFRRGAGDAAGENQQESPGVPRCQPAAVPRSRTIVLHSRCFSVPIPMSRWYNNPNKSSAFPRSRCWRPRYPDYPEHFPMINARPPPQSKPATRLDFRYLLLLGNVRLLWEFLLV